jgi:hypothetical protein
MRGLYERYWFVFMLAAAVLGWLLAQYVLRPLGF